MRNPLPKGLTHAAAGCRAVGWNGDPCALKVLQARTDADMVALRKEFRIFQLGAGQWGKHKGVRHTCLLQLWYTEPILGNNGTAAIAMECAAQPCPLTRLPAELPPR